jgi:hypothetical protein
LSNAASPWSKPARQWQPVGRNSRGFEDGGSVNATIGPQIKMPGASIIAKTTAVTRSEEMPYDSRRLAMKKFCVTVLVLGSSSTFAESPADLLQRVADHYRNATSFEVKGTASALVPGTSWRVSYDFETEGAQPAFLPLSVRTSSMRVISHVGI